MPLVRRRVFLARMARPRPDKYALVVAIKNFLCKLFQALTREEPKP